MTSLPLYPSMLAPELVTAALDALAVDDVPAAAERIGQAAAPSQSDPLSFYLIALLSIRMKEPAAALKALEAAHATAPDVREVSDLLSIVHSHLGNPVDALYFGKLAIAATASFGRDDMPPSWVGTFGQAFHSIRSNPLIEDGRTLLEAGNFAEAAESFRREVEVDRHSEEGWRGLREAAGRMGDSWRALAAADALHSIGAATVEDAVQHAYLYAATGEYDAASILAAEAARMVPDDATVAWALVRLTARRPGTDRKAIVEAMRHWLERFAPAASAEEFEAPADVENRRLHIGLISGRWADGAGLDHLIPILEVLDRRRVKLTVYALGINDTPLGRRLRGRAENWHALADMDRETARFMIRNDELDALIDLDGPGFQSDPLLLLHPPARRSLSLNGVPEASVAYGFTAALGDSTAYPGGAADTPVFAIEGSLATMPIDLEAPIPDPEGSTRPLAFGSLAHRWQITPATAELWSALLGDCPQATLLLDMGRLGGPEAARQTLALFENRVPPGRVLVRQAEIEPDDYLRNIGVLLDPIGNPNSEELLRPLGRGVPAVILRSDLPTATVAAAWLDAHLPSSLVAETPEDYRRKAADSLNPEIGARISKSLIDAAAEDRRVGPADIANRLVEILIKAVAA